MMKHKIIPHCLFILFVFCSCFSGCQGSGTNPTGLVIPEGVSTEPALVPEFSSPMPSEGSLWVNKGASLFADSKAARVGDTVIVDIIENSTSSMDVNTESARKTKMGIGMPTLNGLTGKIINPPADLTEMVGTDFSSTFTGEAKSDRSGQVTASIAARVTEVLPNGNLNVFGKRAMKVNNEVQYITVSGIIRPKDISAANRVKSTYLADSNIEYYGKGALADKQKPGWGTRILENIWPW
ncbi:MAG: flagellin biosynthesis protein FlgH [Desulfobacterales bacterium RIFOXYA12_FULL_46_15]|nr:MAG: flagellin biosynthesis protein FlgH [Desulfobacula sp. GWF2_41_7]OGR27037.1 MAG: flagellin biosynthesis protein FlgH [Desulfobacterales bacterium RIFOXYA12_FULL_46_15]